MKKNTLFATCTICLLLLAGCTAGPQEPTSDINNFTSDTNNSASDVKNPASNIKNATYDTDNSTGDTQSNIAELDSLRSSISEMNCRCGVGFFGYIDSESGEKTVQDYVTESMLAKNYPFLKECTPVLLEGAELYAFVPSDNDTTITVYRAEISEDGSYIDYKDAPLYTGKPGEAVVLRCNLSEIYANVLISVTDGTNTLEFHPMISLESGCLAQEEGCYDFSVYDDNGDKSVEIACERLAETDEVRDALERGMKLLYTGDEQMIEGEACMIFVLGTDYEEQFVREQFYAVSDNQIYVYHIETDQWQVLAAE